MYIFSPGDHYYLDCGMGNKYGGLTWCEPYKTWLEVYNFEPEDYVSGEAKDRVLGGEVCAWSEMNTDSNIHWKLWPRSAAMGERLWASRVKDVDVKDLGLRLLEVKRRINAMGIATDNVMLRACENNAEKCFTPVSRHVKE